jgi:NAD(P)-dependent dehydrogenase (short-subunit alcohol dehydrogenase family)
MRFALDVSCRIHPSWPSRLTISADTQTAIFKETTTNLTPWDDLNRRHPLKGPGFPDDIAKMAVVLASEDASWVTGVCLPVDGGYTAR